jgi:hypothetical protein
MKWYANSMACQQHGFLECLSPGSGFRWLAILVLLERVIKNEQGHDARVRHEFKKLGMIILVHEMECQQHGFLECLSPGSGFRWLAIVYCVFGTVLYWIITLFLVSQFCALPDI